jgi:hypothetical protein
MILAAVTGTTGMAFLMLGSANHRTKPQRFHFGMRTVLVLAFLVAAFFSGMATGLHQSQAQIDLLRDEDPVRAASRLGFEFSLIDEQRGATGTANQLDHQVRQAIRLYWVGLPKEKRAIRDVQAELHETVDRAIEDLRTNVGDFLDSQEQRLAQLERPEGREAQQVAPAAKRHLTDGLWVDEHGIIIDCKDDPAGIWGIDGPPLAPQNRR